MKKAILKHIEPSGVSGGCALGDGVWNIRTLNTIEKNNIEGLVLNFNQVELEKGIYNIKAFFKNDSENYNQLSVQDIDFRVYALGRIEKRFCSFGYQVECIIHLEEKTIIQFPHRFEKEVFQTGFGKPENSGKNEEYGKVIIEKME